MISEINGPEITLAPSGQGTPVTLGGEIWPAVTAPPSPSSPSSGGSQGSSPGASSSAPAPSGNGNSANAGNSDASNSGFVPLLFVIHGFCLSIFQQRWIQSGCTSTADEFRRCRRLARTLSLNDLGSMITFLMDTLDLCAFSSHDLFRRIFKVV